MNRAADSTRASTYFSLIPSITKVAREFGYATSVHGSLCTDLDLVLTPWVNEAREPEEVVEAIRLLVGGWLPKYDEPTRKPFGRLAWSIYLTEDASLRYQGPYLDISVTPKGKHKDEE